MKTKKTTTVKWQSILTDELNPAYIFQGTDKDLLVKALNGEIDLYRLVRVQLAARGLGSKGTWVGFTEAKKELGL